jgi:hypothetical protein
MRPQLLQAGRQVVRPLDGNDLCDDTTALGDRDRPTPLHPSQDLTELGFRFVYRIGPRHGPSFVDLVMMVKSDAIRPTPQAQS